MVMEYYSIPEHTHPAPEAIRPQALGTGATAPGFA
jgi:hypothetical protein